MIKKAEDFISAIETARSSRIDIIRVIAVEEAVMYLLNIRAAEEHPFISVEEDTEDKDAPCPVCRDIGGYPVHNEMGKELYMIPCPECGKRYDPDGHLRVAEEMLAGAEEATSNAVDPDEDHTVSLGDAADAVVKTSMQRACEGAGWMLVDSDQDTFSFMNEDGQGYLVKRWANTNEREAWADLYDYVQRENGVVPHTTMPDDAHLLRVAKALAFQGFGTPWDTIGATSRDFYLNLARVALENYEAFK